MGIDSGYGSSEFAIIIQQVRNRKAEIVYSDSFARLGIGEAAKLLVPLIHKYHIGKVYIDASDSGLITELKLLYKEYRHYDKLDPKIVDGWITSPVNSPKIVPVDFRSHGKEMLDHLRSILERHLIRIDPQFEKVNVALRTATYKGDKDQLDKGETSEDDTLDALRLSLLNVRFRKTEHDIKVRR
jgi:hypothetical protein